MIGDGISFRWRSTPCVRAYSIRRSAIFPFVFSFFFSFFLFVRLATSEFGNRTKFEDGQMEKEEEKLVTMWNEEFGSRRPTTKLWPTAIQAFQLNGNERERHSENARDHFIFGGWNRNLLVVHHRIAHHQHTYTSDSISRQIYWIFDIWFEMTRKVLALSRSLARSFSLAWHSLGHPHTMNILKQLQIIFMPCRVYPSPP